MLISLDIAKAHLRIDDSAQDVILALYIGAAEQSAADYLNRRLYADQIALDADVAAAPGALTAATATYTTAIAAAALIVNAVEQAVAIASAGQAYTAAQTLARETKAGMVVNDAIKAAVLLTLGDLFNSREDAVIGVSVAALPIGARALMQPHRCGLGI